MMIYRETQRGIERQTRRERKKKERVKEKNIDNINSNKDRKNTSTAAYNKSITQTRTNWTRREAIEK